MSWDKHYVAEYDRGSYEKGESPHFEHPDQLRTWLITKASKTYDTLKIMDFNHPPNETIKITRFPISQLHRIYKISKL